MSLLRSLASTVEEAKPVATGVATVDAGVETGPPRHLASGVLYGIPDEPDQVPDHFYQDIGFNYGRGGGSQLPNTVGFARSLDDYKVGDVYSVLSRSTYNPCVGPIRFRSKQLPHDAQAWWRLYLSPSRAVGCRRRAALRL